MKIPIVAILFLSGSLALASLPDSKEGVNPSLLASAIELQSQDAPVQVADMTSYAGRGICYASTTCQNGETITCYGNVVCTSILARQVVCQNRNGGFRFVCR